MLAARLTSAGSPALRSSGRSSGVEHNLAKVGVEGSNPFARSIFSVRRRPICWARPTRVSRDGHGPICWSSFGNGTTIRFFEERCSSRHAIACAASGGRRRHWLTFPNQGQGRESEASGARRPPILSALPLRACGARSRCYIDADCKGEWLVDQRPSRSVQRYWSLRGRDHCPYHL